VLCCAVLPARLVNILKADVVLCCAALCCAVLCCAVLCCAVLCCAVLCCAVLQAPESGESASTDAAKAKAAGDPDIEARWVQVRNMQKGLARKMGFSNSVQARVQV
jgi:hypothetical protein